MNQSPTIENNPPDGGFSARLNRPEYFGDSLS